MTDQEKYAELLQRHQELTARMQAVGTYRNDLRDQMDDLARSFPPSFYYRIDDNLLYRANKGRTIELIGFTK